MLRRQRHVLRQSRPESADRVAVIEQTIDEAPKDRRESMKSRAQRFYGRANELTHFIFREKQNIFETFFFSPFYASLDPRRATQIENKSAAEVHEAPADEETVPETGCERRSRSGVQRVRR